MVLPETSKVVVAGSIFATSSLAGVCCLLNRKKVVEIEEEEAIPTSEKLDELIQDLRTRNPVEAAKLRREQALSKLPRKPKATCQPPPGCIQRLSRTFVPQVHRDKTRNMTEDIPVWEEDSPMDPKSLWSNPTRDEYDHRATDATRWAWNSFIVVDQAEQLISTQTTYTSEKYNLRIELIPCLRLADKLFFDSVMEEAIKDKSFVISENLHREESHEQMLKREMASNRIETKYSGFSAEEIHMINTMAYQRGIEHAATTINAVGGQCVVMDYLQTLIENYTLWTLGDPALSAQEFTNIAASTNIIETFKPLCEIREAHLLNIVDKCLLAAEEGDDAWEKITGQKRTGEKVICLPWNGRHCDRIEKFLVKSRGFKVEDAQKYRIIFDPQQVVNMVLKANSEIDEETNDVAVIETVVKHPPTILGAPEEVVEEETAEPTSEPVDEVTAKEVETADEQPTEPVEQKPDVEVWQQN